jgi:glycosyltransferase involved in cell wall biosynthesis
MAELRESLGCSRHSLSPQIVVPIGVNHQKTSSQSSEQIDRRSLVYIGTLREGQGLDLIFKTFPKMLGKIPDLKLVVIGEGPMREALEQDSISSGVSDRVHLLGFLPDHRQAEEIISKCGIGLAPYEPENSLAKYTEPSKPKTYMACGLPVIITKVPRIASDIDRAGAGIAIDYSESQLIKAVERLVLDKSYFEECRRNALDFVSTYEWPKVYSEALNKCQIRC